MTTRRFGNGRYNSLNKPELPQFLIVKNVSMMSIDRKIKSFPLLDNNKKLYK